MRSGASRRGLSSVVPRVCSQMDIDNNSDTGVTHGGKDRQER